MEEVRVTRTYGVTKAREGETQGEDRCDFHGEQPATGLAEREG